MKPTATPTNGTAVRLAGTLSLGVGPAFSQSDDGGVKDWVTGVAELDVSLSMDYDPSMEWGLAASAGTGDTRLTVLVPRVRLLKDAGGEGIRYFGTLGVPVAFSPEMYLGAELGGGIIYPLWRMFELVGALHVDTLFALDPLSSADTVFMFNASVGGRMIF
ncbi:MAG: hypothetical protein ACE366_09790 [Bradymonadia bacterium]